MLFSGTTGCPRISVALLASILVVKSTEPPAAAAIAKLIALVGYAAAPSAGRFKPKHATATQTKIANHLVFIISSFRKEVNSEW
jgi:hypothetical protein